MRRQMLMAAIILVGAARGVFAAGEGAAPEDADAKRVVARVNQVEITYGDFKQRLENLEKQRGPIRPEQFKDVVRGMIQEEILLQEAMADGMDQDAPVKAMLEQARRQVLIEELLRRSVLGNPKSPTRKLGGCTRTTNTSSARRRCESATSW